MLAMLADAAMTSSCLGVGDGYPWSFVVAGAVVIISLIVENTMKGVMLRYFIAVYISGCLIAPFTVVIMPLKRSLILNFQLTQFLHRNYGITDLHGLAAMPDGDAKKESLKQADRVITACFLEGGIVFHSIFVGINYGISENDSTSIALLIALIFHQVRQLLAGCCV
jgi:hypothetical protein